ncbi:YidB family protein [Bosea thiooxidans]|nr:YidB family protein [Bosea sp. (in: a-proteobacteria)]
MTALLGLLAVAGYQHRDQIADWFRNNVSGGQDAPQPGAGQPTAVPSQQQGGGGLLGSLGGLLGAGGAGAILNSGLGELVDRFNQSGQGDKANSWVGTGPNQDVAPGDLEQALGPEVLDAIAKQTGLSREDLLARLSKVLPDAVDRYTPGGNLSGARG